MNPLDALIEALGQAGRYDSGFQARPEAVLWCDPDSSFSPIIDLARERIPHLFTLGRYDPDKRSAPAFELRATATRLETDGPVPIFWLPNISREALRTIAALPPDLEPLAWFTASGVFFGHVNGKDWSLRGFLVSERGPLRLDIAEGNDAREVLSLAAPKLMTSSIESLRGRRFDVEALHALTAPDPNDEVLDWMEGRLAPETEPARYKAFAQRMTKSLGFDPRKRSRQEAVRAMAERRGSWEKVWKRYEAASLYQYPETTQLLRVEEPPAEFGQEETFPQANLRAENGLREALRKAAGLTAKQARDRLKALERDQGHRRETLWGRRGEAPLAHALKYLARVGEAPAWPTENAEEIARHYVSEGSRIDHAAVMALAAARRAQDREAVAAVLRTIYAPWLDEGARSLQAWAATGTVPFKVIQSPPEDVTAVIFIDGLRFDLAERLAARLLDLDADVTVTWRWSGFPTSTACCKPLVSPAAAGLTGPAAIAELLPTTSGGQPVDHRILMKELERQGYGRDVDAPLFWKEVGDFDEDGHNLGARLVDQLESSIENAAQELVAIARSGKRIRVVTDHGWILMPGGLEQAKLGPGLTEPDQKRTRYARLKDGSPVDHAQACWTWDPSIRLAMAPGATSFYAGQEYAHGGVSPQECVIPIVDIEPMQTAVRAQILDAGWTGLRLRAQTSGAVDQRIDLRRPDAIHETGYSVKPVTIGEDGKASIMARDEFEGSPALLVIIDDDDRIVARKEVVIGG